MTPNTTSKIMTTASQECQLQESNALSKYNVANVEMYRNSYIHQSE